MTLSNSVAETEIIVKEKTNSFSFINKVDIIEKVINNNIAELSLNNIEISSSIVMPKNDNFKNESIDEQIVEISKSFEKTNKSNFFFNTQRWMGHIYKIKEKSFFAKLDDLNNPTTQETVEIDLIDVSKEDRELVEIGAGFYLSVGHSSDENGQIEKKSLLRFQRTKPWDNDDLDIIISSVDYSLDKFKVWE